MPKSSLREALSSSDGLVKIGRDIDYTTSFDVLGTAVTRISQIGLSASSGNSNFTAEDLINLNFVLDGNWVSDEELKLVRTGIQLFGAAPYQKEGKMSVVYDDKIGDETIKSGIIGEKAIFPQYTNSETILAMKGKTGESNSSIYAGIAVPKGLFNSYVKHFYPNLNWDESLDYYKLRKADIVTGELIFKTGSNYGKVFSFPVIGEWNPPGNDLLFVIYLSAPIAATQLAKSVGISISSNGKLIYEGDCVPLNGFSYNFTTGKTGLTIDTFEKLFETKDDNGDGVYNQRVGDCFLRFVIKDKEKASSSLGKNLDDEFFKKNGDNVSLRPVEISYTGSASVGAELMWMAIAYIGKVEGTWTLCYNPGDRAGLTIGHFSYTTAHQSDLLAKMFEDVGERDIADSIRSEKIRNKWLTKNDSNIVKLQSDIINSGVLNNPRFQEKQIDAWLPTYLLHGSLFWRAKGMTSRLSYCFCVRASLQTGGKSSNIINTSYVGSDCLKYLPCNGDIEREKLFLMSCFNGMIVNGRAQGYGGWVNEGKELLQIVNQGNLNIDVLLLNNFKLNHQYGTVPADMVLHKDYIEKKARELGII